jgi:hypothetical protein
MKLPAPRSSVAVHPFRGDEPQLLALAGVHRPEELAAAVLARSAGERARLVALILAGPR